MKVTLYTKPDCVACGAVLATLRSVAQRYDIESDDIFVLNVADVVDHVDIDHLDGQLDLAGEYGGRVPVVEIEGGKYGRLESPFDEAQLRLRLEIAWRALHPGASVVAKIKAEGSPLDRMARYIAQRWLRLSLIALGIFVGLPWLAPVFAALGWWGLADPIYTAYAVT